MTWMVAALMSISALGTDASESFLLRVEKTMQCCSADVGAMAPIADEAAARLAAGGKLWASGNPSLVSEISGRAGGFMMIRPLGGEIPGDGDVVMHLAPGTEAPPTGEQALVVTFTGAGASAPGVFSGHGEIHDISLTIAASIPAWLFTGELFAALTRLGKTPVMYESIGAYDGNARIQQYKSGDIAFHEDLSTPPVAAGTIANAFLDIVSAKLLRIEREMRNPLEKSGAWAREAREAGKRCYMYSMGHLFPDEVGKTEIGALFRSDTWNAGFRRSEKPKDVFESGDFVSLIGYQQPADDLLRRARPAGARVVYVTLRSDRDFVEDPGVIWIDPMWDWPDACVSVEGYDVPLLAASGILNGAIAWEIYRLAQ